MRFYDVEDGGVFVDGRDVRTYEKDELHRKFGVVFQNDMVFFNTLRENIRFGRDLDDTALTRAAEDAVAAEYIDSLEEGLDYRADIKGANLSGGQRQRVRMAMVLAQDTPIVLLDEPTSFMDVAACFDMVRLIRQVRQRGKTVVAVIHDLNLALSVADQVFVMERGRLAVQGEPTDGCVRAAIEQSFGVRLEHVQTGCGTAGFLLSRVNESVSVAF